MLSPAATGKRRLRNRILAPTAVLLLLTGVWLLLPEQYRARLMNATGAPPAVPTAGPAATFEVIGTVTDDAGRPAVGVRVRGDVELEAGYRLVKTGDTDEHGAFRLTLAVDSEDLHGVERPRATLRVFAEGREGEFVPSAVLRRPIESDRPTTIDLRLGVRRMTVPVHVVDLGGGPVTGFRLQTMPEAGVLAEPGSSWPQAQGTGADGTVDLAVPEQPFRVEAHVKLNERSTTVGPFDPAQLPATIEITLPDR